MEQLTVKIEKLSISYGNKDVLMIDELSAYENDRIGIIGGNGEGKSTLLKLIAGIIQPDTGTIQRQTAFNYFPQIGAPESLAYSETLDMELMSRFRVPQSDSQTLSGGEETKFRLAQVLSTYQAGLLLDEPTTHLDQKSMTVLTEELRYYYGTLLFVSHDRHFLNALAEKIWEVAHGEIREYQGNYDDYLAQKEQEKLAQVRAEDSWLKEKSRLETAVQKKKEQAKKISQVSAKKKKQNIRPDRLSSSKQKDSIQKAVQKQAKAMETRLSKLTAVDKGPKSRDIIFPAAPGRVIHNKYPVRGENVTLIKGKRILLENCDFQFGLGKKIALTGENGIGKTSLLQHILQVGEGVVLSPKVRFVTYQQMDYKLTAGVSVLEYLMEETDLKEALVRSILNNLGFAQTEVAKPVSGLSGGEATRVAMAQLFVRPSNVMVLDEPTNFIDLLTITALEKFLKAYQGTVLFTSHDPVFVAQTADEVYRIEDRKLVPAK